MVIGIKPALAQHYVQFIVVVYQTFKKEHKPLNDVVNLKG